MFWASCVSGIALQMYSTNNVKFVLLACVVSVNFGICC